MFLRLHQNKKVKKHQAGKKPCLNILVYLKKKKKKKLHTVNRVYYAGLQDGLRGEQEACIPLPSAPSHSGVQI